MPEDLSQGRTYQVEPYEGRYDEEISLLDIMVVFAKWRRLIAATVLLFAVGALIFAFMMTPLYKASVLVAETDKSYLGLLKSSAVQDRVLDRFAPKNWREMVGPDKKLKKDQLVAKYIGEMEAQGTKEGVIKLSVTYTDPKKAAEIANEYVNALENVLKDVRYGEYRKMAEDYAGKLNEVSGNLRAIEKDLAELEGKLGIGAKSVGVDGKIRDLEPVVAEWLKLQEKIMDKVMLISEKEADVGNNPEVATMKEELSELNLELEQYEDSIMKSALNSQSSASLEVFSEYLKKRKEWLAQQELYQKLQSLYDKVVLQEKTLNVSVVSLGIAQVPDKPFKPNKKLLLAVALVLGLFIGVFSAFFMEFFHRASEDPEEREKVKLIKEAFTLKGFFKS